jgi:hypothetical protein
MEIKKISKKDKEGKRLFVELTKKLKFGKNDIPDLKAGDEVILLPITKQLSEEDLRKLVGKHLKYYLMDGHGNLTKYEGILQENKTDYVYNEKKHGKMDGDFIESYIEELSMKFVLLDKPYSEEEDEQVLERFDDLYKVIDLEIKEPSSIDFNLIECTKCKRNIPKRDKFCKFCGKMNMGYKKNPR